MKKLGFIGMGNMASAILLGAVRSGFLKGEESIAYDLNGFKLDDLNKKCGMAKAASAAEAIDNSEIVLLAVKPKIVESVLNENRDRLKNKTLLSVAAGWQYSRLRRFLDNSTHICAIMPNTPAMVGEGMTIIESTNDLSPKELIFTRKLFSALGEVEELSSDLMGIGGTLSGCGPAWVFMMIEALADGAVYYGLPRDIAYKLASQTVLGSGKMARDTKTHPGKLKDDVCSPGGITIRGVKALEAGGLRIAMMNAMEAAYKKPD
ncbi:pyrroline-5-carboxylate reductase [Oxalobacter paraformigenes]|uniref:Pyrroline-5-carboxylate reductase n=1 Tax=Oxalobacter paraformigenes TaxID=556268 RepID=C3X2Q2_9BURK|nr:pyrroline-5-carboxylate reductase [Oxalobacter paraformigenes]EEO27488.2 pyrroline-5-carboxylate reductase [Oxalobacter paraformigenes]